MLPVAQPTSTQYSVPGAHLVHPSSCTFWAIDASNGALFTADTATSISSREKRGKSAILETADPQHRWQTVLFGGSAFRRSVAEQARRQAFGQLVIGTNGLSEATCTKRPQRHRRSVASP